jgi:uncharacterized protein YqhQ
VTFPTLLRLFAHTQMLPILESGEETLVGGQAVMEGVMMRAPHSYCVAVRKADGEIVTEETPIARMSEKYPLLKYPVLRGIGTLVQAMGLGMRALKFSAEAFAEDENAKVAPEKRKPGKQLPEWALYVNMAVSIVFFLFLYKWVPLKLATWLGTVYPSLQGHFAKNGVDGVIRIVIFLVFLYGISRAKDIRRVFEYHGAEHKVVFNFESGKPVTVENAQKFVTYHPRCGTSFLVVVMVISMLVYMLVPFEGFLPMFLSRIVLLPLIIGLSYEVIRFAARRQGSFLAILTAPGLWTQRITTKPPSDEQAQVAIKALDGAMALETRQGGQLVIA